MSGMLAEVPQRIDGLSQIDEEGTPLLPHVFSST